MECQVRRATGCILTRGLAAGWRRHVELGRPPTCREDVAGFGHAVGVVEGGADPKAGPFLVQR